MIEEKNVARRELLLSLSFISSNRSVTSFPFPNICTIFWFSTISSISSVCSPRISDWSRNISKVFLAINPATRKETGVMRTTTKVMPTFTDSINPKVPTMVATPVKNWVNPIRSPSAN